MIYKVVKCLLCEKNFNRRANNQKFCSPTCARAHFNHVAYSKDSNCIICGNTFQANKYRRTKTCNPECTAVYIRNRVQSPYKFGNLMAERGKRNLQVSELA